MFLTASKAYQTLCPWPVPQLFQARHPFPSPLLDKPLPNPGQVRKFTQPGAIGSFPCVSNKGYALPLWSPHGFFQTIKEQCDAPRIGALTTLKDPEFFVYLLCLSFIYFGLPAFNISTSKRYLALCLLIFYIRTSGEKQTS